MPLPDLIEIMPLTEPVRAEITVPGSKSITNRALILAALADGKTTLQGALWSEDTQIMVDCLQKLGFEIEVTQDSEEFCNRTIVVQGLGGKIPNAGTAEKPLELFVGNAGTAARFLSAFVCLGIGVYRIYGIPRMNERPKSALFRALRELGYRVETPTDKLPVVIHGGGPRPGKCMVSIEESSQFASALLLCAKEGGWEIKVVGENDEESPYVAMTSKLVTAFPRNSSSFQIEPDASSGSYFWGVGYLLKIFEPSKSAWMVENPAFQAPYTSEMAKKFRAAFSEIRVRLWPDSGWQIDEDFTVFISSKTSGMPIEISRKYDLGDSIMTAIALSPIKWLRRDQPIKFTHLGRLRLQETERVAALKTELTKCGAKAIEEGDTLTVYPSVLHGAEIETYDDHRMAMCFAILGLKVAGIKIKNPACVKKTFPNFFQKLAAAPPKGLGATIRDGRTGRVLAHEELFAD